MLDVAEEEEEGEGVLGLEEGEEEEEWEVDDEKILQAQREMQQKNQQLEVGGPWRGGGQCSRLRLLRQRGWGKGRSTRAA